VGNSCFGEGGGDARGGMVDVPSDQYGVDTPEVIRCIRGGLDIPSYLGFLEKSPQKS